MDTSSTLVCESPAAAASASAAPAPHSHSTSMNGNQSGQGQGHGGGGNGGKDSPPLSDSVLSDQENEIPLEEYAWKVYKESGLLAQVKSQLVKFLEDSGRLHRQTVKPKRADSEILQHIYEYLDWIGMKRAATMVVSESPLDFNTNVPNWSDDAGGDRPNLLKMFTYKRQQEEEEEKRKLAPPAPVPVANYSSETFTKSVRSGHGETFGIEAGELEKSKVAAAEVVDNLSNQLESVGIEEEEEVVPETSLIEEDETSAPVPAPTNEQSTNASAAPKSDPQRSTYDFPPVNITDKKYRDLKRLTISDLGEEEEEESKSYSEVFDNEEEEEEQDSNVDVESEELSIAPEVLKKPEDNSSSNAEKGKQESAPSTPIPPPPGTNKLTNLPPTDVSGTDDSISDLMDNLTVSDNTEDMSINSDSKGITSCEHGIDLD